MKHHNQTYFSGDLAVEAALRRFRLERQGIHGIGHWMDVYNVACDLAHDAGVLQRFTQAFYYFAVFHDCCREDELDDPTHGVKAAEFFLEMVRSKAHPEIYLSHRMRNAVAVAIELHNTGATTPDLFMGICWDADRLDLPRVGVRTDPDRLSTDVGRQYFFRRGRG